MIRLSDTDKVKLKIENVGGISNLEFDLDTSESMIYVLVGPNGSGKSTVLSILGTLVVPRFLRDYRKYMFNENSKLIFEFFHENKLLGRFTIESTNVRNWTTEGRDDSGNLIKFQKAEGFYEPSVEILNKKAGKVGNSKPVGKRRPLSVDEIEKAIEMMTKNYEEGKYKEVDKEFKEELSFVLTGSRKDTKFKFLKRVVKDNYLESHFLLDIKGKKIPEEKFSFGEKCVLQILKFLFNSLNARKEGKEKVLIIDEIELGLHPLALRRLINVLYEKFQKIKSEKEGLRVIIILTTHSPIVLSELFGKEGVIFLSLKSVSEENKISKISLKGKRAKWEKYVFKKALIHPDSLFVIVVEDWRAKKILERLLENLRTEKKVVPEVVVIPASEKDENGKQVGGWTEAIKKALGIVQLREIVSNIRDVVVILDGDVDEKELNGFLEKRLELKSFVRIKRFPLLPIEKFVVENFDLLCRYFDLPYEGCKDIQRIVGKDEDSHDLYKEIEKYLEERYSRTSQEIENFYIRELERVGFMEELYALLY